MKTKIYPCKHFEYEYDDWGKYCWCHNRDNPSRECDIEYKFCMDLCPFFEKDVFNTIEIETDENTIKELRNECAKKLKEKIQKQISELEESIIKHTKTLEILLEKGIKNDNT